MLENPGEARHVCRFRRAMRRKEVQKKVRVLGQRAVAAIAEGGPWWAGWAKWALQGVGGGVEREEGLPVARTTISNAVRYPCLGR